MSAKNYIARWVCITFVALSLAGCAGNRSHSLFDAIAAESPNEIAAKHSILIATTREKAENPAEVFSGGRGDELAFARVDVTIPAVHKTGFIEQPGTREKRNAAKHFAAADVGLYHGEAQFLETLRQRLKQTNGRALVFVHGYRTPFDSSVYRAAQIVNDSGYSGTAVLFSWASTGRTVDYIYDNNSATVARDGLENTLRVLHKAGAKSIDIVAHSMGNWLTMEALRQLAISGDHAVNRSVRDVILASPDIDVDVFKSQLQRIGKPERPYVVMLSRDDRALLLSSIIAGNRPRVGDYGNDKALAELGIVVVDLSNVSSSDSLNHAKFADNPALVQILGEHLNESQPMNGNAGNDIANRLGRLTQGVGQTLGTAAEIIITTPFEVINVAIGGS